MAAESKVQVIISVMDKYSRGLNTFSSKMSSVSMGVAKISAVFAGVGIAAGILSYKLGTELVRAAANVEEKIFDVAAVAQGTLGEQALPIISDIVDELTIKFPIMGVEAGKALEIIAQLGYSTETQMRNLSDAAVTLGVAVTRDVGMAASTLVSTLNQFSLGEEEATRVSNVFAAAQFNSAAALEDLQVALRYVGSSAALTGQSIEGTVTAIAMLRNMGFQASQAGTQLRMVISKLLKPTAQGKKVFEEMGLALEDITPSTHSFAEIIGILEEKQMTLTQAIRLFGQRAGPIITALVDKGAASFKALKEKITDTDAATTAYETKMLSFNNRIKFIVGSIDVLKKTIAGPLLEAIKDILGRTADEGIGAIVNKLSEMEKEFGLWGQAAADAFGKVADKAKEIFEEKFHGSLEEFYEFGAEVFTSLGEITIKFVEAIQYLVEAGIDLVRWWRELNPETREAILHWGQLIAIWGPVIATVGLLVAGFLSLATGIASVVTSLLALNLAAGAAGASSVLGALSIGAVGAAAGLAGLLGVAAGGLLVLQHLAQNIELIAIEEQSLAAQMKSNIETLGIYRNKWGIYADTIEEAYALRQKQIAQSKRTVESITAEIDAMQRARDVNDDYSTSVDKWIDKTNEQIIKDKEKTEVLTSGGAEIAEQWLNGVKVYENTALKAETYGNKMRNHWQVTASIIGATPLKPGLDDVGIKNKIVKLREFIEKKLGDPVTIEVFTRYHDESAPG